MSVLIIDLETEYHKSLVKGSTPFDPELFIVSAGWCKEERYGEGKVEGVYFGADPQGEKTDWLPCLNDVTMIVGHNIAFDLQWLLHRKHDAVREFLRRGGKVFDTALGHFLLSGFTEKYPRLNDIAPMYGGTVKVDVVAELWRQGKRTSEIPREVLHDEYLMSAEGETLGDIENTRRVFWGQVDKLLQAGLWDNALLRMQGLVFNILSMYSGLHVDRAVAEQHMQELNAERDQITESVNAELEAQLPEGCDLKITAYTMSSLLYGGYFKYESTEDRTTASGAPMFVKADVYEFQDGTQVPVEGADIPELEKKHGPAVRYKAGKNKGGLKVLRVDTDVRATRKCVVETTVKGILPLNKLPAEWRDNLKSGAGKRVFGDGSPVLSTKTETLEGLLKLDLPKGARKVLEGLVRLSAIDKDLGTYYMREDGSGKVSGAMQYLGDDNIIHHELNVVGTHTGRLSAARPNVQNIPRGDTSNVKKIFTSRFNDPVWLKAARERGEIEQDVFEYAMRGIKEGAPVGRIVEMDYTALEVVVLAVLTGDRNLKEALLSGKDMHCMRLAQKLGEDYESVLHKCKDDAHPDHGKYKVMRTNIKPPAFAYQYGATAHGLVYACGMTLEEAEAFIQNEKALFPEVEEWFEEVVFKEVQQSKRYERRSLDDGTFTAVGIGTFRAPSGTTYTFEQQPTVTFSPSGQRETSLKFKPTQMRNYPVQGEASLFVQASCGRIAEEFLKRRWDGLVYLINQVHDAAYFDCVDLMVPRVVKLFKPIMEDIPEFFKDYGYNINIPFPVEAEAGLDMFNKSRVE